MIQAIVENWYVYMSMIILAVFIGAVLIRNANVKEWLRWAVTEAEIELGSGTGQLKLRRVYDKAVAKFPYIAWFIKFSTFSKWVDEALDWMKFQIENNEKIEHFLSKGV